MPYPYSNLNPWLVPAVPWTRSGASESSTDNLPFSLSPVLSSPAGQAPAADPNSFGYGYDNPIAQTAFLRGQGPQSADDAMGLGATTPDGDVPFSLAPVLTTPVGPTPSSDPGSAFSNTVPITPAGFLRGPGVARPGLPAVPPIPPGPFDWQNQTEQAIMRLWKYFRDTVGTSGSAADDGCDDEIRKAREICIDAYANGWKSDHDVGPYRKPGGGRWTPQDCMRGLISERCGGNLIDRGKEDEDDR